MTDDHLDWRRLPEAIVAVLALMPTGEAWKARFAAEPGLAALPFDDDGFLTIVHRGDVVMKLGRDVFDPESAEGTAKVMVNAQWREVSLLARGADE